MNIVKSTLFENIEHVINALLTIIFHFHFKEGTAL